MATAIYPDLDRADLVFPLLAFDLLPVGFRGLILAALAAAILSSLEAIFNSAATLFTMDFVPEIRPGLSEKALVRTGRIATVGFMVLSTLWAPQIANFPTLWQYLQSILSYVTPPVVVVFVFGIFWPRGTAGAAAATLLVGIFLGAAGWLANEVFGLFSIQYLYACGILFAVDAAVFVAASLLGTPPSGGRRGRLSPPPAARVLAGGRTGMPFYKDYRVLSAVLVFLAMVIVVFWW
jgi:SSS family solute:Na+ symporter